MGLEGKQAGYYCARCVRDTLLLLPYRVRAKLSFVSSTFTREYLHASILLANNLITINRVLLRSSMLRSGTVNKNHQLKYGDCERVKRKISWQAWNTVPY